MRNSVWCCAVCAVVVTFVCVGCGSNDEATVEQGSGTADGLSARPSDNPPKDTQDETSDLSLTRSPESHAEPPPSQPEAPAGHVSNTLGKGAASSAPALLVAPFSEEQAKNAQNQLSRFLSIPAELTNETGINLVLIPPGEFQLGTSEEEIEQLLKDFPNTRRQRIAHECPLHAVRITKPFYLGVHEVTMGQFQQFVELTNYTTDAEKDEAGGFGYDPGTASVFSRDPKFSWRNPGFEQSKDHPVVNVSWNDAIAFCDWLSEKEGKSYRLPTEAEWEYACRAGTTTRFYCGNNLESLAKVGNAVDEATIRSLPNLTSAKPVPPDDGHRFTAPVGQFPGNAFGIYDMHGNACEACQDAYSPKYYAESPVDDPIGPSDSLDRVPRPQGPVPIVADWLPHPWDRYMRVGRGSSWGDPPSRCRSATRLGILPWGASCHTGFRVALAAVP